MTIHPADQPAHLPAASASGVLPLPSATPAVFASGIAKVAAQDLYLLPAGPAIDLTGITYAHPVPRGHGDDDHCWQWAAPRREDGWTSLYGTHPGQSPGDPRTRRLRRTLSQEYVMLRVDDPAPHTTTPDETGRRQDRVIGVHRRELLTVQTRAQRAPGDSAELAGAVIGGIETVLADAAGWQMRVVLALSDGTRLNGVPELGPPGSGTVQVREEAGQESFTVRLTQVIYVRPVISKDR